MNTHPCPRCGRPLSPTGELSADGITCPVYQCDQCTQVVEVEGVPFTEAITFIIGPDGVPFNPADEAEGE